MSEWSGYSIIKLLIFIALILVVIWLFNTYVCPKLDHMTPGESSDEGTVTPSRVPRNAYTPITVSIDKTKYIIDVKIADRLAQLSNIQDGTKPIKYSTTAPAYDGEGTYLDIVTNACPYDYSWTSVCLTPEQYKTKLEYKPSITADISPSAANQSVTITGYGFQDGLVSSVTFGDKTAAFQVLSDTEIQATVPDGSGTVNVSVQTSDGTSNHRTFTYK